MKIIAFYLPQFHFFPENDKWWGKGFTEWTNTKKSVPLYKGHYEPREPLNDNYYNLLNRETFRTQINLAKKYGVYGFCFYHYWFGEGNMLMEKPLELFLSDKTLQQKFCISWANETWSRTWDGREKDILIKQEHGNEETWTKHFYYLLDYFKDDRYIFVDEKPLFVLYKPEIFPNYNEMFKLWNQLALENGLKGITFSIQSAIWNTEQNNDDSNEDYRIMFEPGYTGTQSKKLKRKKLIVSNTLYSIKKVLSFKSNVRLRSYDQYCGDIISRKVPSNKYLPGFFVDWDNTPRKGQNGYSFQGSTPEKFGKYLSKLIYKTKNEYQKDIIFLNAWNEWAEGCYLEPDKKFGYGYLENLKEALESQNEFPKY